MSDEEAPSVEPQPEPEHNEPGETSPFEDPELEKYQGFDTEGKDYSA
jgi:hypothetical protein